jgi:DNA modification methylase
MELHVPAMLFPTGADIRAHGMNRLFFGDNLDVLRGKEIKDESVDLVYLDPPFNSNTTYNVLFRSPKGEQSVAQIAAFEDSWHWGPQAELEFNNLLHCGNTHVAELMKALRKVLGENDMMAYLTMMANRLLELRRVLKPTGSLYLHCDPTASHYLKVVLDGVFGAENFRNEVVWKRTNARGTDGRWPRVHDVLFFYSVSDDFVFHPLKVKADKAKLPHTLITGTDGKKYQTYELTAPGATKNGESGKPWRGFNPNKYGRHWANGHAQMDTWDRAGLIHWPKDGGFPRRRADAPFEPDSRTITVGDVWTDVDRINQAAAERLGYPTQKPLALLERIILAASDEGGVLLDPFCGCGTAIHAAQKLKREWVGIDVTHLAIAIVEKRLRDAFPSTKFEVHGTPTDIEGATDLAERDKYEFQYWACSLVNAQPYQQKKKGADGGIDGVKYFVDDSKDWKTIIVSVKGGSVSAPMVRDLRGVLEREGAAMALFVTLLEPTKPMQTEALKAGFYADGANRYPRIQILTIKSLLDGTARPQHPGAAFDQRRSVRARGTPAGQGELFVDATGKTGEVTDLLQAARPAVSEARLGPRTAQPLSDKKGKKTA